VIGKPGINVCVASQPVRRVSAYAVAPSAAAAIAAENPTKNDIHPLRKPHKLPKIRER
jgi:hypothetical protein